MCLTAVPVIRFAGDLHTCSIHVVRFSFCACGACTTMRWICLRVGLFSCAVYAAPQQGAPNGRRYKKHIHRIDPTFTSTCLLVFCFVYIQDRVTIVREVVDVGGWSGNVRARSLRYAEREWREMCWAGLLETAPILYARREGQVLLQAPRTWDGRRPLHGEHCPTTCRRSESVFSGRLRPRMLLEMFEVTVRLHFCFCEHSKG